MEAIAPGHSAPDGVFHAAARGEVQTPQLAGADARIELISERTCAFVRVVIHDGERAVYASTSKQAGMGGLNGELATVAGKATPDLFWGIYAAQQAVRTRVGAVWEYPELEMRRGELRLVGATTITTKKGKNTHTAWYEMRTRRPLGEIAAVLQTCHANRNQTDVEQIDFPSLAILEPAEVCPAAGAAAGAAVAEAAAIVSIVKGDFSSFAPVQLARLEVPNVIRAEDAERRDESFDAGVETGFDTMAFYELSGMVAGFSHAHAQILYHLGAEAAGEIAAHRSTRAGNSKAILQDVTRQLERGDDLRDGGDDDDDAGGSPVDGDEQEGSDDDERGREAHYSPPALQPRTDQPMAFLKRLVPAGLPRDIVEQMRTYQAADPYCIRMKNEVRLATEWATRRQVRAETAVRDGKVTLRLSPVAAVDAKRAAKLEAVLAEFVVGECGMLYHLGEGRDGRAVVEYVVPVAQHQVVLQSAHDGMLHLGRARTLDAVRGSRLWWPSLAADVKRYVKKCQTCAFNKVQLHRGEMHIPPNGLKPWQVVTVDVVDLEDTASGNREAVIFSDRFSRSVRAFAVPRTLSSEMFLNIVAFGLIPDVGVPLMMISDRGSNLISKLCEEFYRSLEASTP